MHQMEKIFVFFILCFGNVRAADPCEILEGSTHVNGKCFKAFNISLTWDQAQEFCSYNLYFGTLAEPITLQERNVTESIVVKFGNRVWLGATNRTTRGQFIWTESNVSLVKGDSWWAEAQPDNSGGVEACVQFKLPDAMKLNDENCNTPMAPLCQIDITKRKLISDPCYPWKNTTYRDTRCLKWFRYTFTWNDAKSFCGTVIPQYQLAEFFTEDERQDTRLYTNDKGAGTFWVGGRRDSSTGKDLVWDTHPNITISRNIWAWGEPKNAGPEGEGCVLVKSSGLLDDTACNGTHPVLCETATPCQTGYFPLNGRCVGLWNLFPYGYNVTDAQTRCAANNGTVAELTDADLQELKLNPIVPVSVIGAWVGGNDLETEGTFVWTNSKRPIRLNWWQNTEPNNNGGNENCVEMYQTGGYINDQTCSPVQPFVCVAEVKDTCDEMLTGSTYISGNCFKYYETNMTWEDAQSFCLHKNSHLAEPTSDVLRALAIYLRAKPSVWIGASDRDKDEEFTWATSGELVNSANLRANPGQGDYLAWNNSRLGFTWENRPGDGKRGFVCQTAAVVSNPRQYVAIFPKMSRVSSHDGYLQVTAGYSFIVYVRFTVHIDTGTERETVLPLTTKKALRFNLTASLTLSYADVSSSFVEVVSSQPVTVVLYITDQTRDQSSSALIFPTHMYNWTLAAMPYVLFSVVPYQQDIMLSVIAMTGGSTDVNVVYSRHGGPLPSFSIGRVSFRNLLSAKATLKSKYDVMTASMKVNLDGAYVNASQPVAVFLGSLGDNIDGSTIDSTMDQLLPITYLGNEYIIFPSYPMDSSLKDNYKFVAVNDWTRIEIFETSGSIVRTLESVGDVIEIPLDSQGFFYVHGNSSFYAFKIHAQMTGDFQHSCMTTILPSSAWQNDYHFEINAAVDSYTTVIYIIVETFLVNSIEMDYVPFKLDHCSDVRGSQYSGCYIRINTTTQSYYHIGLGNQNQNMFGAYMFATNSRSALCHPLGISDTLQPSTDISYHDYQDYLARLLKEQDTQLQTNCSAETTTAQTEVTTETADSAETTTRAKYTTDVTIADDLTTAEDGTVFTVTSSTVTGDLTKNTSSEPLKRSTASYDEGRDRKTRQMISSLFVDAHDTSAYRRSKSSVQDRRISSIVIGAVGIATIATVLIFISISDFVHFASYLVTSIQQIYKKYF